MTVSPEKIRQITKYFSRHKGDDLKESIPPSNEFVSGLLFGGIEGRKWAQNILEKMEKEENKIVESQEQEVIKTESADKRETFNVEKSEDKENFMEKEIKKEEEMADDVENKEEMAEEEVEKKEEMASEENKEESSEGEKEEMASDEEKEDEDEEEKEDEEEEKKEEKKFEFPHNFDFGKIFGFLEEGMKEKFEKEEIEFSAVIDAFVSKMETLSEENKSLKEYKKDTEEKQKKFAVEKTLMELSEKVVIPDDIKEELRNEAEKYSLENIEGWKNYCKAKSFDFAMKNKGEEDDFVSFALPFTEVSKKEENDLWS